MNATDAIRAAKQHILDIFREEDITHVGLEEVDFDHDGEAWNITIGFQRPWEKLAKPIVLGEPVPRRTYKVVRLNDADGRLLSIRHREVGAG